MGIGNRDRVIGNGIGNRSAQLSIDHITKRYPGVVALDDVSFEIRTGHCHALCGENGAGKSTLGKILAGSVVPDAGRLVIDGRPVHFATPADALRAGVAMVHQELAFCENLSVAENLCLSALPSRATFVSRSAMRRLARERLAAIGAEIDLDRQVGALSIGEQQLLQIAEAVSRGAKLIVFDEPTSSLSEPEAQRLYDLIRRLRSRGVTCVYVSHRLEELFGLCDEVTVLRDGRHVLTAPLSSVDRNALVEAMVGRRVEPHHPAHLSKAAGRELLRVEHLSSPAGVHDVSLSVRAGEVVGLAGLVGAGRSQVAQAVFGLDAGASGAMWIHGRPARPRSAAEAISLGVGLVPEDRKRQGLVLAMSVLHNTTLAVLQRFARLKVVNRRAERAAVQPLFGRLRLRETRSDAPVAAMSGGNQQKVVLTRWLAARCDVLILDEPTRGVDVGAKAEIHALIDELTAGGAGILLISSELPELLNLSTRILVLRAGRMAGELSRAEATQDGIMRLMAGIASPYEKLHHEALER
jgi:ABC-type sugar transport system ATPase subunit